MTFDDLRWHAELACWLICVRASPPYTGKQLLYFRIEYCLMITVPTNKLHKSPFKHSKTIYVFTSGRVIVTLQIHKSPFKHSKTIYVFTSGRIIITLQIHSTKKKLFKGIKMTSAKWTIHTREQQDLRYPAARLNEKGCLPLWGGDALTHYAGFLCSRFFIGEIPLKSEFSNEKFKNVVIFLGFQ